MYSLGSKISKIKAEQGRPLVNLDGVLRERAVLQLGDDRTPACMLRRRVADLQTSRGVLEDETKAPCVSFRKHLTQPVVTKIALDERAHLGGLR